MSRTGASLFVFMCFLLITSAISDQNTRRVKSEFDTTSACLENHNGSHPNMFYARAFGDHDTLHYVMSTYGIPTVLLIRTDLKGSVSIDCSKLFNDTLIKDAINATGVTYAHAIMFHKLYEYNDVNDDANLNDIPDNETLWNVYEFANQDWTNAADISNTTANQVSFRIDSNKPGPGLINFNNNGSLTLQMELKGTVGRDDILPSLQFNENSTKIDIMLDDLKISNPNSRFAIEIGIMSYNLPSTTFSSSLEEKDESNEAALTELPSIDDEHSPGVFSIFDWTIGAHNASHGEYVQWKPVFYKKPRRSFNTLGKAKSYDINNDIKKLPWMHQPSLAFSFFGKDLVPVHSSNVKVSATNISFGLHGDKFYQKTNYTSWTASIGYGAPPAESLSQMIIIVISVGLGLPFVLIFFGGIGLCIKKQKDEARLSPYRIIQ